MKILITGAGGMLGSDLATVLSSRHEVRGLGRHAAPHLEIPFQVGDASNFGLIQELVQKQKPEVILHAAAMTGVDRCESHRSEALRGNLETTRCVTEAANRVRALMIYFSTDFVFDGTKNGPYTEEDVPCPISVYGESKLLGERYIRMRGRRYLILRTSWLFGAHGDNFPKKVLKQAEARKPLKVISDQRGNPTFTRDLAEAVAGILEALPQKEKTSGNQIFHVTNEGDVSRYDLACAILKKRNYPAELASPVTTAEVHFPAARPRNSVLSSEKAKAHFGIELRRWEAALDAYLGESKPMEVPS